MGDKKIIKIDEAQIEAKANRVVTGTVEATLNGLLEAEADSLCGAKPYEHSESRKDSRAGHYKRGLEAQAGKESSMEQALVEMYLPGVRVRRVEDITEVRCGTRVSPSTVSD